MATYYARKSGNVNAADVWATTPTGTAADVFSSFTSADTLMANGFTVTLNVNTTVMEVRNDNYLSATAGGSFTLGAIVLIANIICGSSTACVSTSGTTSASVVGNVTASSVGGGNGITHSSSGTLSITGSVTGGAAGGAGVSHSGGSVTVTGAVSGGAAINAPGISAGSSAAVSITGVITGGANNASSGVIMSSGVTTNVSITGSVVGSALSSLGYGVSAAGGTLTLAGTATGNAAPGVIVSNTAAVTATRAKGGPLSTSTVGISNGTAGSIVTVDEIEYGDLGASPTSGPIRLADKTSNVAVFYRFNTTKKTLVDTASTSLLPAASNVRSGTTYNAGQTTGTCAVPPAGSVLLGVPVDNTTGTAAVSSTAVQSACDAALAAFSSGRLANVATVATTGQQLAAAVGA